MECNPTSVRQSSGDGCEPGYRQVVLDTETTGLLPEKGHRIIEIGAVELIDGCPTGRFFGAYVNPERAIDNAAQMVHGLTLEFLERHPRFNEVIDPLLAFIGKAELIIHNAPFDTGFLDAELSRLGRPAIRFLCSGIVDTLVLARQLHPGLPNNLDALCARYGIDASRRGFHGAMLDASLLAQVYGAMRVRQAAAVA